MLFRKRKKKKLWGVYAVRNLLRFFQQLKKSTNHLKIKMMKKTDLHKLVIPCRYAKKKNNPCTSITRNG